MSPRDASDHLRDFQNRQIAERIARALERMAPPPPLEPEFWRAEAFIWQASPEAFLPVNKVNRLPLPLLRAVTNMRDTLLANTERFARGLPANNALLWGARGMGKSSLVKAIHAEVRAKLLAEGGGAGAEAVNGEGEEAPDLKLVEIHREDIATLPRCLSFLRVRRDRFIVFCDDLSFDADDTSYKSLKAVLEGGIEGRPENVVFYATSNRRHLLPRDMAENERSTAISPHEAVEEKVSLSDRFGLWIGFHNCSQADFLEMVRTYADHFGLKLDRKTLDAEAHAWAMARGSRSGRVAWQFIQDLAGREGVRLD
jgi:predicted AAA+ superfamily ATPase